MSSLPSYVAAAKPVPLANRAAWYKTIAPTYAGMMLWFVFWQDLAKGTGTARRSAGGRSWSGPARLGDLAALICHFLVLRVPGMLGMRTGLPLYIVGTSTYGVQGGFLMPGLLMGVLQFGWLAVNCLARHAALCVLQAGMAVGPAVRCEVQVPGLAHGIIAAVFAIVAAFVGLKGIQYVARVATYLPLIPDRRVAHPVGEDLWRPGRIRAAEAVSVGARPVAAVRPAGLGDLVVIGVICTYIVGFFATAGAAGTDIASADAMRRMSTGRNGWNRAARRSWPAGPPC